ncbi:MAG: SMEK domain-containing protein [Chlorobiaceae bacterium]|nr:SMEK domain-containing protein [Chlorobiaceae bacterium]
MNQESILYRISQLFSRFKEQVKILNANGEFSINIHAENILIDVLNKVYDCDLKNVNYEEGKTYPSIDLRDTTKRISIQVTSTANLEKVKHTLTKFIENNLQKDFDKLYIFIITKKQSKYNQEKINKLLKGLFVFNTTDIIDRTDIYRELNSQNNFKKINSVCELLERQFADNKPELDKWNLYCKGIEEYDKYISNLYNYLDIKGFSPKINNTLVKINLDNIYVPLELRFENDIEDQQNEKRKENKNISYSIEKALNDLNKLVILGDPGSGKSTVLKFLARSICSKRSLFNMFEEYVPIIIKGSEFAKYVSQTSKQLSEYIIDHIDRKYEFLFTEKLERNQLIVLLDGIDEINIVNLRHDVVNRINAFISQYPTTKIIVSSRIVGYKETRLNGYFNHLQVIKFKEKQIKQFVNNWYLSISRYSSMDSEYALKQANDLYTSIRENQSVLNMASNPLLITIIALIYYQGNTLPEKRASLYDIATSTFLENWVRQRDSKNTSRFDKDLLIELLAPIAFQIHNCYTTGLISEKILKSQLTNEYKRINPYLNPKEEKQDIKDIIDFLREDAGFLFEKGIDERGESMFGFVHQTFQEFFTAIELKTRWKEGKLKDTLNEFVFNSNWFEVIKLSASLFKLNEPSRLGRQSATDFVKDILNIDDPYPEIFKPLKLVFQILKDDTEIEFSLFIEIIDKVFNEILTLEEYKSKNSYENNPEVWVFRHLIGDLIKTKTYQSYLLERVLNGISTSDSKVLKINLIIVLIEVSDILIVKDELIKLLKSNNDEFKMQLFNYNTVMPVAKIIQTEEFREEIVKYINSESFIKSYKGHLPTQYKCCFEVDSKFDSLMSLENIDYKKIESERDAELFLSIKLIQNEKIKKDFIDFNVFSWGLGGVENIKEYLEVVKKEYPDFKFTKIEHHINELEKFKSMGLNKYPILSFKSIDIYSKKLDLNIFAFVKNKNVEFIRYPFNEEKLEAFFKEETQLFLKFLDQIIYNLSNLNEKYVPKNVKELTNFIKHKNTLHWNTRIDLDGVLCFAFQHLFIASRVNFKILKWIKGLQKHEFMKIDFNESIDISDFISKVRSSSLDLYDQLYLIYLIGERSDYEDLIRPTIESLKTEDMKKKEKEIRRILHEVL